MIARYSELLVKRMSSHFSLMSMSRFVVGGHEWVLLFYPDGKKSSAEGNLSQATHLQGHFTGNPRRRHEDLGRMRQGFEAIGPGYHNRMFAFLLRVVLTIIILILLL